LIPRLPEKLVKAGLPNIQDDDAYVQQQESARNPQQILEK
jgi:hypothetical protein